MIPPKVILLLATYNGEPYLRTQLDSLFKQTYTTIEIIARDDGSSDNTVNILKEYPLTLLESNQNLGAKGSFSALLTYAVEHTDANYFMFCDQDDRWHPEKVAITLQKMTTTETPNTPTLIHTDVEVVDEQLNTLAPSLWKFEHINPAYHSLNRLLMHNTITGCTTMINRTLAKKALPIPQASIMHDWWLGLVASQFGTIAYITQPTMQYRQHQHNDTGAKKYTFYNILKKAYNLFKDDIEAKQHLQKKMAQATRFLTCYQKELTPPTQTMLQQFATLEQHSFLKKRMTILKYRILKYGLLRNIGLLLKL
jgi:glycosyltransferase involved in cell wall biosynthesis